ncbi:MAG: succinylglutamate desuccinylase/aspartoacylase family protein [Spirochaetes bacterium]|nr:succinylglutamate desuccinylase/aspartoacylase family protein [Spirochaetota bacterium]
MSNEVYSFDLKKYHAKGGEGPHIVITGAIHGVEQTATYTAELVWENLKREKLLGEVTIYPLCNLHAAKANERGAPEDGLDLNRIFPGNPCGSYSEQLASHIYGLTAGADYILDLHCCGVYGSAYTMCWYSRHGFARELCRALGIPVVVHTKGTRGQFYIESCEERGQKCLLVELPGGQPNGVIDVPSAELTAARIMNYLKYIGVIEGEGRLSDDVLFCGTMDENNKSSCDGLCEPAVLPGGFVEKGQAMAFVNGEPFVAPYDAVVTAAPPKRYIFQGSEIVSFAPRAEVQPGEVVYRERDESGSNKGKV